MDKKVTWNLIPKDKVGYNQHDIIKAIRSTPVLVKIGQIAIATTDNSADKDWQPQQLIVTSDEKPKYGHLVYSVRGFIGKFGEFENSYEDECKIIICAYPSIPNIAPISPSFVASWVEGGCKEMVCEYEEVSQFDSSSNQLYKPATQDGFIKLKVVEENTTSVPSSVDDMAKKEITNNKQMYMKQKKYRAWDGEKMLYPKDAHQDAGSGTFILLMDMEGKTSWNNPYGFHPEKTAHVEIMEFIGLKDKNGKEIYEGDILKGDIIYQQSTSGKMGKTGRVEYAQSFASFGIKDDSDFTFLRYYIISSLEIVGNIYENSKS